MATRIIIIGSGNVAEQLALAVSEATELELVQLYARNAERGPRVAQMAHTAWCNRPEELREADLYLVAVSDRAVAEVASSLPIPAEAVVAHTAGSVALEALLPHPHRAILYPFQSFSAGRRVDFGPIPLFLEASSEEAMSVVERVAKALSKCIYRASSEQRRRIHLAGVICNNFTNCLYQLALQTIREAGLPYEVLHALMEETAQKAIAAQEPAQVQTGPARRGDTTTQQRHLELIEDERLKQLYELISQTRWETSKKI